MKTDYYCRGCGKNRALHLFAIILFLCIIIFYSCNDQEEYSDTPGVVLSFDDYFPETWEQSFDLLEKYDAKVTFFVTAGKGTPFMLKAQERGHEIGFHTITHPFLPEISKEQFYIETVSKTDTFRAYGIELTSFAYPYGEYESWMNEELLKYYKVVRGFGSKKKLYTKETMKYGYIYSISIDNTRFSSETVFKKYINDILYSAKKHGMIIPLTSHSVNDNEWGITPERLEYVLNKCREYELPVYSYKHFQEN